MGNFLPKYKLFQLSQLTYNIFSKFYKDSGTQITKQNVEQITALMNKINRKDVKFDIAKVSTNTDAPVSFVDIFEDRIMTMVIFVIRDGCRIPLHDHPNMFGFCKVIQGSARVKCFSDINNYDQSPPDDVLRNVQPFLRPSVQPVVLESDQSVSEEDECCILTPEFGTYHEIIANNGPVAFFDILAPSYDHETGTRVCQYYNEIQSQNCDSEYQGKSVRWLVPTRQPKEFWCEPENYEGPSIEEFIKSSS